MYIRVDEGLGQPFMPQCPAGTQSAQSYTLPFGSAERDITDRDAPQIFKILCGPSPWQQHLRANLNAHLQDLPIQPIRIVIAGEFARRYGEIFNTPVPANAQGFVDRRNAIIYLKEFPAGNVGKSKVGLALHEAVHLFSHPAGKSNHLRGSAYLFLGEGLLEGLTQAITEDIQTAQGLRVRDGRPIRNMFPLHGRLSVFLHQRLSAMPILEGTSTICSKLSYSGGVIASFGRCKRLLTGRKRMRLCN
jgi:hypothetical protein